MRLVPAKTASTVQESAPVRISDLSARSPRSNCSAPMMMDLPAPVSPVMAVKPGADCHSRSSHQGEVLDPQKMRTAGIGGMVES